MQYLARILAATLACAATLYAPMASAQDYPTKPITIVVGYSAGGGVDTLARIVAEKLPSMLGQPVVVENKPGAGAIIGASYVAKAKPDGYTLLMGAPGPIVFNHALYAKLPYGPQDLTPISFVGNAPLILLVNANHPAKTVQELVAYAKQNPDKSNYSASSASFQLITELFNRKTGTRFAHIPYKSATESVNAIMSGDVTMALADAGPATIGLQSGRVKALAVTSAERLKEHPQVPTLSELGIDLKVSLWIGLLAPAGTPPEIVQRLSSEIAKLVEMPDVKKRISGMSVIPMANTPQDFAKFIASEIPLWKQVALDNNIKVE
ncbi:MAG: tripartite tricarboxylate transporter substrate binding protein [Burkholderiaceae bacterium]